MLNKLFTTKQKKRSTFIAQIAVPELEVIIFIILLLFIMDIEIFELQKMTYGNLFTYAVPRSMIPIGLYHFSSLFIISS